MEDLIEFFILLLALVFLFLRGKRKKTEEPQEEEVVEESIALPPLPQVPAAKPIVPPPVPLEAHQLEPTLDHYQLKSKVAIQELHVSAELAHKLREDQAYEVKGREKKTSRVKKILRNEGGLRDYIIMAEILKTPYNNARD